MSDPCTPRTPTPYPSDCEVVDGYRTRARERQASLKASYNPVVLEKAKKIRLLLLDVDGVLTDGNLIYSSDDVEAKSFNTQDGFGITLLHKAGLESGIITARSSAIVQRRGEELKMAHICQGARKKGEAFREILKKTGLKPFEVAYMGDDWLDLVLLQQVGLAIAPSNGAPEVQEVAHYITPRSGGHGAVRDACMLILFAQEKLQQLLGEYQLG